MDRTIEVKVYGNHLTKDSKNAGTRGEANITKLRITFDEGWDGYAKDIVFWDAYGENPVRIVLTTALLEDISESTRVYLVPIPAEPMARAGEMTFTVFGSVDNKKQASATAQLEVKASPDVLQPVDPTPSELQQMQAQFEGAKEKIQEAVVATRKINNMTVSAEALSTTEEATVEKSEQNGVTNLHFGLPKGDRGESGVYIGDSEPTDPDINVWIDPNGTASIPSAVSRMLAGSVVTSILAFGAVGDGVTDDTEALRKAARSGIVVYFPAGTYLLYGQIDMSASINWIGEGVKSIIKLMPSEQTRPAEENGKTVYNCNMIHHYDEHNYSLSLQGLVLDANRDGYTGDVLGNGSSGADHTSCIFLNSPALVYLNNVKIVGGLDYGCYIKGGDATDVSISNCRFSENGTDDKGTGLHIESVGIDARVTNCELNSNGFAGVHLLMNNGAVLSNIVCHNNGHGIVLDESNQNIITGAMCSSDAKGIALWNDSKHNIISGLVTKKSEYGILFGDCDKNIISGWCSVGDDYKYCVDYFNATKEITGSVFGISDTDSYADVGKTEENKDFFKVNFIGG